MKKITFMSASIALLFSIVFLSGCNLYAEKYPEMSNGEVWICNEPEIFFREVEGAIAPIMGTYRTNDTTAEMCLLFEGPFGEFDTVPIKIDGKLQIDWLLSGRCKFKKDWFSIKVSGDKLFDNQYETLTFRRFAKDEVEWIDGWPMPREGQGQ